MVVWNIMADEAYSPHGSQEAKRKTGGGHVQIFNGMLPTT
jgi:hypothetical protein